jgi:hypothetical protein
MKERLPKHRPGLSDQIARLSGGLLRSRVSSFENLQLMDDRENHPM